MTEKKTPTATVKQRPNAPEFVLGKFGFEFEKLIPYVNERGWINFNLLKSKDGGQYIKVDDYGIKQEEQQSPLIDENIPF